MLQAGSADEGGRYFGWFGHGGWGLRAGGRSAGLTRLDAKIRPRRRCLNAARYSRPAPRAATAPAATAGCGGPGSWPSTQPGNSATCGGSVRRSARATCPRLRRVEEHTSELQALKRISYAVCRVKIKAEYC